MSSFDDEERRSKLAVLPKSSNSGKVVKLEPKKLKTEREVRTVLNEEKYLENLEKIIVKDYFPELPKLKAQSEYMDAIAKNDVAKMRELQLRFNTQRRTDRRTSPSFGAAATPISTFDSSPRQFDPDTPGPSSSPFPYVNEEGDNERKQRKPEKRCDLEGLSVDTYLNKFTSQDNASFEELTALAEKREKSKNAWLYEAAELHNKEKVVRGAIAASADLQLALKYDAEADKKKPLELDNWNYTVRSDVLFHPEGAKLTIEEENELKRKNQRVINKNATRFSEDLKNKPSETSMARAAMLLASNNAGKVDITGHEAGVSSKTLGLLVTPSPAPGIDDSPFMTWGEIDGTPFRLDATDVQAPVDNAPTFKMPEVPFREKIAQGLSDTIAKRYSDKRKNAMVTAERAHKSPRFGSIRSSDLSLLSPAARKLATNKLGIKQGTTPIVSPRMSSSRNASRSIGNKTPNISSMIRLPQAKSITDDLMKLSSDESASSSGRAKAGDFF